MRIGLYMTETDGERQLEHALMAGFAQHRDETTVVHTHYYNKNDLPRYDLIVFVGVRRKSRRIYNHAKEINARTLMIDKGYMLRNIHYRFSLDGVHPPHLGEGGASHDRFESFGISIKPPRFTGSTVLFAGSSQKYCDFHELGDCSDYASAICSQLIKIAPGRVVYRPKPSWWGRLENKRVPKGAILSGPDQSIQSALDRARCVVTHGSNTGIEALIAGIPVVTTATSRDSNPIFDLVGHDLQCVLDPPFPAAELLRSRLAELAWCQFSLPEISSGLAWDVIRKRF